MSFVPTTYCNDFNAFVDFQKFFRSLRVKEFFANRPIADPTNSANNYTLPSSAMQPTEHTVTRPFRGKSTFVPPKNRNASLDTYCRLVERDALQVLNKKREYKVHNNLPRDEREALLELKKDSGIIVKPADKGGSIVVMNLCDYDTEVNRQLSNQLFYQKLDSDPSEDFKKNIHCHLSDFLESGDITKKEFDFMKIDYPTKPVIYTLPKIHKNLEQPPGRPIISGIGSLTEKISTFVDYFLKPHVATLPSYVKDTIDMINILKSIDFSVKNMLLVTLDVESLYTNIPHEGGIEAVDFYLRPLHMDMKPSITCIKELVKLVLTKNAFMYKDTHYLQVKGTAMGSTMAPNYASLYVGSFEHDFVFNRSHNDFFHHIGLWRRYIDDIFILWSGTPNELFDFVNFLNVSSNHLKFTVNYDDQQINFLDILIKKEQDKLSTDLYRKPTDRNTLLHGKSFHPTNLKKSLPISQLSRVRRICSSEDSYAKHSDDMVKRFRDREYQEDWVQNAVERFKNVNQKDCLEMRRTNSDSHRPICAIQFSPLGNSFKEIVQQHWHILKSDPNLKTVFNDPPRIVYKRAPNLRDQIVRADLPPEQPSHFLSNIPPGNYKCGSCAQCNFTSKCHYFNHPHSGKKIDIKGTITCNSKNVIYMIKCPCGLAYIGKTTRCLKTRISEHRSSIRTHDDKSPVAVHFNSMKHNLSSLRYFGIEHVKAPRRGGDINNILLRREAFYIFHLNTLSPKGLNLDFDLKPFL